MSSISLLPKMPRPVSYFQFCVLTPLPARPENASYHTRFQGIQVALAAVALAAVVLAAVASGGADTIPAMTAMTHTWAMSTVPQDGTARRDCAFTNRPPRPLRAGGGIRRYLLRGFDAPRRPASPGPGQFW